MLTPENWINSCIWGSSQIYFWNESGSRMMFSQPHLETSWCRKITHKSKSTLYVSYIQRVRVIELCMNLQMFELKVRNLVVYLNINFVDEKIISQIVGLIWTNRVTFLLWIEKIIYLEEQSCFSCSCWTVVAFKDFVDLSIWYSQIGCR